MGIELACRRPAGPTEAGARLMVHVASVLLRIDAARAEVQRVKGKTTRRPTVGICPPAATAHALRIIGEVSRRAGAHELTVRTLPRQAVAEGLATAKPDLGLADGFALPEDPLRPPRAAGLRGVPVCREPVVVALPAPPPPGTPHGSAAGGPDGRTVDRRTGREPLPGGPVRRGQGRQPPPHLRVALRYDAHDVRTPPAGPARPRTRTGVPAGGARSYSNPNSPARHPPLRRSSTGQRRKPIRTVEGFPAASGAVSTSRVREHTLPRRIRDRAPGPVAVRGCD